MPPLPFAKALTLFNQLLGFFSSKVSFLSYSVVSPIYSEIIINTLSRLSTYFSIQLLFEPYFNQNLPHSKDSNGSPTTLPEEMSDGKGDTASSNA